MKKATEPAAERPVRAADRIRASASELFYREGIRAVGVDEVVERAGVTKPSLYRSFASKDDLAAAYMRDYDLDFWEKFESPGGKSYHDAREGSVAVSATKSATGHLLGAAGGVEAIFTILALRDQVAPPTLNLENADPAAEGIDLVANVARPMDIEHAISNGFGFGGVNASLVFRRWT